MVKVEIKVYPKKEVLDPVGETIKKALRRLGVDVESVRAGKLFTIEMPEKLSKEELYLEADRMCKELLANPLIEEYEVILCEQQ